MNVCVLYAEIGYCRCDWVGLLTVGNVSCNFYENIVVYSNVRKLYILRHFNWLQKMEIKKKMELEIETATSA